MGQLLEWFRDSGFAALIASVLSVGALIISALAWRSSRKTERQFLEIETARERDRLSKARKAFLMARMTREERLRGGAGLQSVFYLVIENRGEAEARDIRLRLDGRPFREHCAGLADFKDPQRLGPGSPLRYQLALAFECVPPFNLELSWRDDSGEPGSYQTTLTI